MPVALLVVSLPLPMLLRVVAALLGAAWLVVARLVVPRPAPRACRLVVEPGAIAVRGAGLLTQRIRAPEVRAASAARCGSKFVLALVRHDERDPPLWIELDAAADVERVRLALGIGRAGLGELWFPPQRGVFHTMPSAVDAFAGLGWAAMVLAACMQATEIALVLALLVVPLSLVAMVLAALPRGNPLALGRNGIYAPAHGLRLAWAEIADAWPRDGAILVRTVADRFHLIPMRWGRAVEGEYVVAQIRSAVGRARGEGPPPPETPASLAVLARREEANRAWLERIDAAAASFARAEGYRHTGVDPNDLWAAIEDPDAPAPVRAAAARVLARIAPREAGDRIALALAREHDADVSGRIRVALEEDVDLAAGELDRMDRAGGSRQN
jgi:hypothetical protein